MKKIFLIMFLVACHCQAEENHSSESVNDMTCDANKENCNSSPNADSDTSKQDEWSPFRYQSSSTWVNFKDLYSSYIKWHNKTLFNTDIPCNQKKVLVFTPNAGLGDSIGALSSGFFSAIKTGRMLFIKWKPHHWTIGLRPLPFFYDYQKAAALRDNSTQRLLLCVEKSNDPASFLNGHVTNQDKILSEPILNDFNFPAEKLSEALLRPSKKVEQVIRNATTSMEQISKKQTGVIRKVALVIRTGETDYNQFLSKGDEMNFVKCFRNYARTAQKRSSEKINFILFITSDSASVKKNVVRELKEGDYNDLSIKAFSLNDSIIHVMDLDKTQYDVKAKIRKTYAEFFLIGRCQVLFLTHGSLFGRAAAERGKLDEADVHYISDSNCDGKREKYSYLKCHEPKYPKVCGFD